MKKILDEEIKRIKLSDDEVTQLKKLAGIAIDSIEARIKKRRIDASVFVGGSLAKDTIMKKNNYDIDLFVRFNKKYSEVELKKHLRKMFFWFKIKGFRTKKKRIHGSRDYYKLTIKPYRKLSFEVVPSLRITSPGEARNITDLSYFHVNYVTGITKKNKKLSDEILLAKSFCHGQKCYGAESYIRGFSGYAIELLICHYKTFRKFLGEVAKSDGKIILDPAKHYKNKQEILETLNPAKIESPIILVDPTYKERNAAGALSSEVFEKFKKASKEFLKKPDEKFFENTAVDIEGMKDEAKENRGVFAAFEFKTNKQPGDIAGTKLLKFSKVFSKEIAKHFKITKKEFEYFGVKKAENYYVLERKKENILEGPSIHNKKAVMGFKRKHRIWYVEEGKIKTARRTDLSVKEFLKEFKSGSKKLMRQMSVKRVRLV